MNDNVVSMFFCKECGGHDLVVTHIWSTTAGHNKQLWQEWGHLKDNHQWKYDFQVQIDEDIYKIIREGAISQVQHRQLTSEPVEFEIFATETNQETDEYFVNCGTCDREIEFGWSQPDHCGLIFPVESSDFIYYETWPDPKYLATMQPKAWSEKFSTIIMTVMMRFKRLPTLRWVKRSY